MAFITRRLAFYAVAAWVAITVNFAIPRVMPGNAVDTLLAKYPTLDANSLKALEAEFGTAHARQPDQPVLHLPRETWRTGTSGRRSTCIPPRSRR